MGLKYCSSQGGNANPIQWYEQPQIFILYLPPRSLFLDSMTFLMCFQKCLWNKIFAAYVTLVRAQTCVISFMYNQSGPLCKRLATLFTGVRFFTCMCTLMNSQITALIECLTTQITNEWFLACVCAPVDL
jgi:hypothetical protein